MEETCIVSQIIQHFLGILTSLENSLLKMCCNTHSSFMSIHVSGGNLRKYLEPGETICVLGLVVYQLIAAHETSKEFLIR